MLVRLIALRSFEPTAVLLAALALTLTPAGVFAQDSDTLRVPGLDQPVEILKDRWGIAHIYAETSSDSGPRTASTPCSTVETRWSR